MAIHAPITGAPLRAIQLPPALAFIMGRPVASRDAVELAIQAAIDALDQIDGDPDLEAVDEDGDWLCHPSPPVYGEDQTHGPLAGKVAA